MFKVKGIRILRNKRTLMKYYNYSYVAICANPICRKKIYIFTKTKKREVIGKCPYCGFEQRFELSSM